MKFFGFFHDKRTKEKKENAGEENLNDCSYKINVNFAEIRREINSAKKGKIKVIFGREI